MKRVLYIAIVIFGLIGLAATFIHRPKPIYTIRECCYENSAGGYFSPRGWADLSIIYVYEDSTVWYWTNWEISKRSTNKWYAGRLSPAARAELDKLMANPNAEHSSNFDIYVENGRQQIPDEIQAVAQEAKSLVGVEREERELLDYFMKYK